MTQRKLPEKYKTCDWLRNYGSIGLTKEEDVKDIAKHFFELGLKAQKGE